LENECSKLFLTNVFLSTREIDKTDTCLQKSLLWETTILCQIALKWLFIIPINQTWK